MTVYIIRHGESLANLHADLPLRDEYKDITDEQVPLSQWGYEQAREAGKALRSELNASHNGRELKMFRSPFLRTKQTAQGIQEGLGDLAPEKAEKHPHLQEQCFGLFDCITDRKLIAKLWPEEHARFTEDRRRDKHHAKAPGGESRADVVERAQRFVDEHRADFEDPNTDVVIIGHGLINRAVEMCLRGLDAEWLRKEPNPSNCSIRKLEGDLRHGYSAEYIHAGKKRPEHLPADYKTTPHQYAALIAL